MPKTADEVQEKYGVSKSSASMYVRTYKTLLKKIDEEDTKDLTKVQEAIKGFKPNTQRAYLLSIMRVADLTDEQRTKIGKAYVNITANINKQRAKTTREVPEINFKRKVRLANEKINNSKTNHKTAEYLQNKLVILLHSEIPVRRAMDWYDMELVPEKTKDIIEDKTMTENYYNMKDFIFKKYKSVKTHGVQVVTPPPRIKKTVQLMLKARGEDPGEYLFLNTKGQKFTNPTWNKYLTRLMDVSTNTLRKVYANTHINTEAVKKAMEIAEDMGHSIETADKDYYDRKTADSKK